MSDLAAMFIGLGIFAGALLAWTICKIWQFDRRHKRWHEAELDRLAQLQLSADPPSVDDLNEAISAEIQRQGHLLSDLDLDYHQKRWDLTKAYQQRMAALLSELAMAKELEDSEAP